MAKKFSKSGVKFEGIRKKKSKWVAEIKDPFKQRAKVREPRIWLGTFETPEEASKVYQLKKMEFESLLKAENSREGGDEISIGLLGDEETAVGKKAINVDARLEKVGRTIVEVEDSNEINMELLGVQEHALKEKAMDVDIRLEKIGECCGGGIKVLARYGSTLIDNYGRTWGEFSWIDDLSITT